MTRHYLGPTGEGTFNADAVLGAADGTSWALGGENGNPYGTITLGFDGGSIINDTGADLIVYDSFGSSEGFSIEISQDGSTFYSVGTYSGLTTDTTETFFSWGKSYATHVDISGLSIASADYLRLTTAPRITWCYPEAFDLDAIEILHYSSTTPHPRTLHHPADRYWPPWPGGLQPQAEKELDRFWQNRKIRYSFTKSPGFHPRGFFYPILP